MESRQYMAMPTLRTTAFLVWGCHALQPLRADCLSSDYVVIATGLQIIDAHNVRILAHGVSYGSRSNPCPDTVEATSLFIYKRVESREQDRHLRE